MTILPLRFSLFEAFHGSVTLLFLLGTVFPVRPFLGYLRLKFPKVATLFLADKRHLRNVVTTAFGLIRGLRLLHRPTRSCG